MIKKILDEAPRKQVMRGIKRNIKQVRQIISWQNPNILVIALSINELNTQYKTKIFHNENTIKANSNKNIEVLKSMENYIS